MMGALGSWALGKCGSNKSTWGSVGCQLSARGSEPLETRAWGLKPTAQLALAGRGGAVLRAPASALLESHTD